MSDVPLDAILARVDHAGEALRERTRRDVAETLAQALELLAEPELAVGRQARQSLPAATGLSLPMVAWALAQSLRGTREALDRIVQAFDGREGLVPIPARRSVVVLAGNVFTAGLSPVVGSLLSLSPTVVKASTKHDLFPRLLELAVSEVDPDLAEAFAVLTFPGGSLDLERALFQRADVVSAYGGDRALASIRSRIAATTHFVGHGHGLGAVLLAPSALGSEERARAAAASVADDVAAYDQRGCLSPHSVWVCGRSTVDGPRFASLLAEALEERSRTLPRGSLPTEVGAAQIQWRGVAAARGTLLEGDGWAVAHEAEAAPRLGPGWRNVQVLEAPALSDAVAALRPFGQHLKAVGVAGDDAERARLRDALAPTLAPRVCPTGTMQSPPLDALADGRPLAEGFVRWVRDE